MPLVLLGSHLSRPHDQCLQPSSFVHSGLSLLRANAQKYREKGGHGQNLTNLFSSLRGGINEFSMVSGSFFLNTALLQEYLGKWISDSLWPKNVRIN